MEKDFENLLSNITRYGTVSSINTANKTARVIFEDKDNLVSGWLHVIQRSDSWMPNVNDTVLVIYLPIFNADGFILGGI